jgi:metallophosphoesterase (TIGR00282 family)
MRLLYVGDVMAEPGIEVVERVLPKLRLDKNVDAVIAQAENVTDGKGMSLADFSRLKRAGVDFFTGGNHSFDNPEILPSLSDPAQPVIRPANYPEGTPGLGYKYFSVKTGEILVVSLLGQVVGKDASRPMQNPLGTIDRILEQEKDRPKLTVIVNFHGDYSSEKVVIGHYLDGRVGAVIGDHWHVQTADARVLPGGTAHISDVGMCGVLDSSLGVKYDSIVPRWRDGVVNHNELETSGPKQFCAVLLDLNNNGLADSIESINLVV